MALTTVYNTGTITLANGDTAITGVGTAFVDIGIQPNDVLWNDEGTASVRIASVTDNTHMVAAKDWGGTSLSGSAYEIRVTPPSASIAATVRALLDLLTNGALTLLAGLSQTTGNVIQGVTGVWQSVSLSTALTFILTTDDDILQRKSGSVVRRTVTQLLADLLALGPAGSTLNSTGLGIGKTASATFDGKADQNGITTISLDNQNSGASAGSQIYLQAYGDSWNIIAGSSAKNGNKLEFYRDGGTVRPFALNTHGAIAGNGVDAGEATLHLAINGAGYQGEHWLDGTAYYIGQNSNGRSLRMFSGSTSTTGVQLTAGATSWSSISDETQKDIIEPITGALAKVATLRTVIGKFKNDPEGTRRSFLIAQDVRAVLPEAVSEDADGTLNLRYTDVIPLLVSAINELGAHITSQSSGAE